jgi:hypothetical protein
MSLSRPAAAMTGAIVGRGLGEFLSKRLLGGFNIPFADTTFAVTLALVDPIAFLFPFGFRSLNGNCSGSKTQKNGGHDVFAHFHELFLLSKVVMWS